MINLNYILEYVTLAETLSYTKTAEKLFTAQSAISRHIAIIEEDIGAKLFERNTRNVQMTVLGQEVYKCFSEFMVNYSKAKEQALLLAAGKIGTIKISSPYYWTEDFVEPIFNYFTEKYPKCNIDIISCQPVEGFQEMYARHSDLSLSLKTIEIDDNIRRFEFTKEKMAILMRTDHPLAHRVSVKLDELNIDTQLLILPDSIQYHNQYNSQSIQVDSKEFSNYVLSLLDKRQIKPQKIIYAQQIDTIGLSIQQTGGISIAAYGVRHMNRSYIKTVPLEDADFELPMCFYYRTDNENPVIPQFLQASKEVFQNNPML